jgi:hypothetical protein
MNIASTFLSRSSFLQDELDGVMTLDAGHRDVWKENSVWSRFLASSDGVVEEEEQQEQLGVDYRVRIVFNKGFWSLDKRYVCIAGI